MPIFDFPELGGGLGEQTDQEGPLEPDDDFPALSDEQLLAFNPDFQELPEELQALVLASESATSQLLSFFQDGGQIEIVSELGAAAQYQEGDPPIISIDAGLMAHADDGDNDVYDASLIIMPLAHELGHYATETTHPWPGGSLDEYYDYRAAHEALAIINEWNIGGEIEANPNYNVIYGGYGGSITQLDPFFQAFEANHDMDALVNGISAIVMGDDPPIGTTDVNGDGVIDMKDRFAGGYPGS